MHRTVSTAATRLALILALVGGAAFAATTSQSTANDTSDPFHNLKFRNLGPAVAGGRVSSVVGVPGDPSVYYVGAAGGGVWKTTDGGESWKAIFEDQPTASIGSVALAPSNPSIVWVGTGEANPRNDITDGHGVFRSTDGGKSWQARGLENAGQVGRIAIDPTHPDTVFVAALGHPWAPNPERGVFKSTDGGATWRKVLFVDDLTGASDVVFEPGNPQVLFAAMWQMRRYPWELVNGGPGSGLYRSTDGGETWKKLTEDLPKGPFGRLAIGLAPSDPERIYALVEAKKGMLWRSDDLGDHWHEVSESHALNVRPFYFSQVVVAPDDPDRVYFLSFKMLVSTDGGKTTGWADSGVHPDHHALWIDPQDPRRMIQGNDGGVFLTRDRGENWRFLDNLPIEQFYMVAADSRTPYFLCGGLQDNSAWCGPSSNLSQGNVNGADWYTVTGGDGEYAVPAPSDPTIVYTDSQNGYIQRLDLSNHRSRFVRPYLLGVEQEEPAKLEYRFNWTAPIAVSPRNADEVYLGANVLFHSTDGGAHWEVLGGDLTRNDKAKQKTSGGPIQYDISGAETYDTILSITLAPSDPQVVWVGTDDGLVQLSRDGGKSWQNVAANIPKAPAWARVYQIGVSPSDAGTAYVAFDAHMLGDRQAYAWKTSDFGASWTSIAAGLPADTPVHVIREDPNRPGFLVAGTDTSLFVSPDGGKSWQRLSAGFPTAPVWDLQFVDHDLVVATHGRGLFVLDDLRPVEEMSRQVTAADFHLFTPAPGTLFHRWRDGSPGGSSYSAPNAPEGVVLDYFLKEEHETTEAQKKAKKTPVEIVVTDGDGNPVATEYGPAKAGINRYVWKLRYDPAKELDFEKKPDLGAFAVWFGPKGPSVVPGSYYAEVRVGEQSHKIEVQVQPDPNLDVPMEDFRAQAKAAVTLRNELSALNEMLNRVHRMLGELGEVTAAAHGEGVEAKDLAPVAAPAKTLADKLRALRDDVYNADLQHDVIEDDIHYLARFHDELDSLAGAVAGGYADPPGEPAVEMMATLQQELAGYLGRFNALLGQDVADYNKLAFDNGAPTVWAGKPIEVEPAAGF